MKHSNYWPRLAILAFTAVFWFVFAFIGVASPLLVPVWLMLVLAAAVYAARTLVVRLAWRRTVEHPLDCRDARRGDPA